MSKAFAEAETPARTDSATRADISVFMIVLPTLVWFDWLVPNEMMICARERKVLSRTLDQL